MLTMFMSSSLVFQSTLSMRRATHIDGYAGSLDLFQSTLSMRRATLRWFVFVSCVAFQSTLSMRRATLDFSVDGDEAIVISIHALHEESDRLTTSIH